MSVSAIAFVWDNSPSKSGRLIVLLALADHANEDWVCWPHVKALAKKARLSPRQVERALKELDRDGEIEYPPGRPTKSSPIRIRQIVGSGSAGASDPSPATKQHDTGDGSDTTPATGPCKEPSGESPEGTVNAREAEIQEVWATYQRATGKTGMELNDKRRKIINSALDTAGLAKCKLAVIGLSVSPHHRGENSTGTPYLDIRYALKGIKDESDDERIDRMASLGAQQAVSTSGARIDHARVDRRLEEVRANRSSGGSWEPSRAKKALEELEGWGFTVVLLDEAPWARLETSPGEEAA